MVELSFTDFFPDIAFHPRFQAFFSKKLRDQNRKLKVKKQVKKIICTPTCGKPLKHNRKGTMEVYISPFRLYYCFAKDEKKIYFLEISHKDNQ